jgi:dTDP-4-dehydrorhamnose reductase
MRILILGGNGMLGHELLRSYSGIHDVRVTLRGEPEEYLAANLFTPKNAVSGVDVSSPGRVEEIINEFAPEAVINAIGIIKQRDEASSFIPSIEINALFPHKLASVCEQSGARLIHMSTDCVFSGDEGHYTESEFADARDLYGRTKYLGEIGYGHCVTLRTSIIGLELQHRKSLIEWFLAQKGEIRGYRKAIYSGLTTMEMARVIDNILLEWPDLRGIYHVASAPISKFDLLNELARQLDRKDIRIIPDDDFVCDRSLDAGQFRKVTGYEAPAWESMLAELADRIKSREKGISV